jgi:hypothetical protein
MLFRDFTDASLIQTVNAVDQSRELWRSVHAWGQ